jgi:hypothetical protein
MCDFTFAALGATDDTISYYIEYTSHLANLNIYTRKIGKDFRNHFWIDKTFPVLAKVVSRQLLKMLFFQNRIEDPNITCQYVEFVITKNIMFYNICPKNVPFWPKSRFLLFLRISIRFLRYSRPQYRILSMSQDVIYYLKMGLCYDFLSQTISFLIFSTFKKVKKRSKSALTEMRF